MDAGSSSEPTADSTSATNKEPPKRPHWWLSELHLARFKAAFRPPTIHLKPFTVLVGRNGSGKSTLVESLQWLDTSIRHDIGEASERYGGVHSLINLRQRRTSPHFELQLRWEAQSKDAAPLCYRVRIDEAASGVPAVTFETLYQEGQENEPIVWTNQRAVRVIGRRRPEHMEDSEEELKRWNPRSTSLQIDRIEELALRYIGHEFRHLGLIGEFWARAVFLRLSPHSIARGAPATPKSPAPLLDEEGENLPSLLNELTAEQLNILVARLQEFLPGIEGVIVSHFLPGRDSRVHYSLHERMDLPEGERMHPVPIPSWMLSEGTRRLTALLALLVRKPAPSLLCIEEIENGLDPWTLRAVLGYLQTAAEQGTQVILTTHSPWVLDAVPLESILEARREEGDVIYEYFATRPDVQRFADSVLPGARYVELSK